MLYDNDNIYIDTKDTQTTSILKKYGVKIPDEFQFSSLNVVIGSNGSGKTRFLRAIRELYRSEGENKIVYGYFPDLAPHRDRIIKSDELPVCTLYESLQENGIEFEDFLKEVELHNEEYIPQLLKYHSRLQKERGEKALETLKNAFSIISGKEFILDEDVAYIKDKNGKESQLKEALSLFSPGELMIFYISVFLSLQKNSNQKRVIIFDEPECHLHPKALLKFIQLLIETNYFSSIWIATHSLFLLPEFDFKNIIYIENSKVEPRSSRMYNEIFSDLLGDDIKKITLFISSLSQWQYCEYIAECFVNPEVIDKVNPKDEQVKLFINFISNRNIIKVLDFGGGSARLGRSLKRSDDVSARKVLYEIYDNKPSYTGTEFTVHKSIDTIKEKYDCVVMMNVLHEIEPHDWIKTFKEIDTVLKDDSYLLFVETSVLTKGEMPNKTGFLVLGDEELNILFSRPQPQLREIKIKDNQKSICIPIHKKIINRITEDTIKNAINCLEDRCFKELKIERRKADFQTSRYYAFLTQLYINAKIYNDTCKITNLSDDESKFKNKLLKRKEYSLIFPFNKETVKDVAKILEKYLLKIDITKANSSLYADFEKLFDDLRYEIPIDRDDINGLWKKTIQLEKENESKYNIAFFLYCLHLLGNINSTNRINNNGYSKFTRKIEQNVLIDLKKSHQ